VLSTNAGAMAARTAAIQVGFMAKVRLMVFLEMSLILLLEHHVFDAGARIVLYSMSPSFDKPRKSSLDSLDSHNTVSICNGRPVQQAKDPKVQKVLAALR
jgi:hypothetical protein